MRIGTEMRVLGRAARRAGRGRPRLYFSFVSFLGHLFAFPLSGGRGEKEIGLPRYNPQWLGMGFGHVGRRDNRRCPRGQRPWPFGPHAAR